MKTVMLRDDDFETIQSTLQEAMESQQLAIQFLAARFGPNSDQVKVESTRLRRLEVAEEAFSYGPSAWRGRGSSITSH